VLGLDAIEEASYRRLLNLPSASAQTLAAAQRFAQRPDAFPARPRSLPARLGRRPTARECRRAAVDRLS
jgi:hypothetical protein